MKYPTIKVVFDRKKLATKTRKGLVQIEILSERKRKWISTNVKVYAGQWHPEHWVVKRLDATTLNDNIRAQIALIQDWVNELRRSREAFEFEKLDTFLQTVSTSIDFIQYLETRIKERHDIRDSTRRTHRKLIMSLKKFGKIKFFSDLTRRNIMAYDEWLHKQEYVQTTIHSYHQFLKIYINDAIRREIIKQNPYTSVQIERGKSDMRKYLTEQELSTIRQAKMGTSTLNKIRDLFVFQCFTGLAYADLAKFDFTGAVERNGKYIVHDVRQKSGENFYIVLLSPAVEILKKYNFKLPLISSQKYNTHLKIVATAAGVDKNLTSHMGRHTFAVYCLNHGVRIETLAKMMGHTDIKTTQLYAKIANSTVEAAFDSLENQLTVPLTIETKQQRDNVTWTELPVWF